MLSPPRSSLSVALVAVACGCSRHVESTVSEVKNWEELPDVVVRTGDWPWWRGPTRDGKAPEQNVPLDWDETKNIVWKVPVPGRGHASPSIWGDRIFVSTADEAAETQSLLCFERGSGDLLWTRELNRGGFDTMHGKNSQASPTPACDGQRVYLPVLHHAALHVYAVNHAGEILWQRSAGEFDSQHGYGSSPVVHGSLVIVNGDSQGKSFIAALHRKSGDIVWKTFRTPGIATFATPMVSAVSGREQLVIHGAYTVSSYDPRTGHRLWYCDGPCKVAASTVTFGQNHVFASGGYPERNLLCIRADGAGDVTSTHLEWTVERRGVAYVPTAVLHGGCLYMIKDDGIATCFDATKGEAVWTQRLEGDFSASPVLVGDRLYVPNEAGRMVVFRAAREFEPLGENDLADGGFASPVICGGRIYLRTNHHLFCIGET